MWSDPRLLEVAASFVPAADEVWRLQGGDDAECRFFQSFADAGHYRREGGTRQGIYACTPGGELLASINSNSADAVLETLDSALRTWERRDPAERARPPEVALGAVRRWEDSCPLDGLVLVSVVRDLPPEGGPDAEKRRPFNRDHVWFSGDEARSLLPADPSPGERLTWPAPLTERLARFHFVDNVRGQTLPFAPEEVSGSRIETEVLAREGELVRIRIVGATAGSVDGPWTLGGSIWTPRTNHPHAVRAELLGDATFDLAAGRFTAFELVALGSRRGRTENNGRRDDTGEAPLGWFLSLAGEEARDRVAPTYVDLYGVSWIQRPQDS